MFILNCFLGCFEETTVIVPGKKPNRKQYKKTQYPLQVMIKAAYFTFSKNKNDDQAGLGSPVINYNPSATVLYSILLSPECRRFSVEPR